MVETAVDHQPRPDPAAGEDDPASGSRTDDRLGQRGGVGFVFEHNRQRFREQDLELRGQFAADARGPIRGVRTPPNAAWEFISRAADAYFEPSPGGAGSPSQAASGSRPLPAAARLTPPASSACGVIGSSIASVSPASRSGDLPAATRPGRSR